MEKEGFASISPMQQQFTPSKQQQSLTNDKGGSWDIEGNKKDTERRIGKKFQDMMAIKEARKVDNCDSGEGPMELLQNLKYRLNSATPAHSSNTKKFTTSELVYVKQTLEEEDTNLFHDRLSKLSVDVNKLNADVSSYKSKASKRIDEELQKSILAEEKLKEGALCSQNVIEKLRHSSKLMAEIEKVATTETANDLLFRFSMKARESNRNFNEELLQQEQKEKENAERYRKELEETEIKRLQEQKEKEELRIRAEENQKEAEALKAYYQAKLVAFEMEVENLRKQKDEADHKKYKQEAECMKLKSQVDCTNNTLCTLKEELKKSEQLRMVNLAQIQELRGNLRVFCRLKPIGSDEERVIDCIDKYRKELQFVNEPSKKSKPMTYFFDYVFDESVSQADIFREVFDYIQTTLDGKRVSIFAYGPTGSGKTFTLEGVNGKESTITDLAGILPRSLAFILEKIMKINSIAEPQDHLEVNISCLEIYNERLNDLLGPLKGDEEVKILMDKGRVVLPDIEKPTINSVSDALDIIRQSSRKRQTEATAWNSKSSRSHSIYRITIVKKSSGQEMGLLNIIDMAGSEKSSADLQPKDSFSSGSKSHLNIAAVDKAKKIQKEANFINKSLTTLGRIIRLIKQQRVMGLKEMCIPYRESKLTRMLQDCIGGDAQTLMIVNINPSSKSASQTRETLTFSSGACV
jgi:hypothetical protein